jgi:hypothetical protein
MSYRLRIVAGPGLGSEVLLEGSETTIGRGPENGLVINDNNVSRVHAKVTLAPGNRVVVADNGSRNGVFVNDQKVNQRSINPGDRVVIGQTVIELLSDARAAAAAGGSGRTGPAASPAGGKNGGRGNGNSGSTAAMKSPDARSGALEPAKGNQVRTQGQRQARPGQKPGAGKAGLGVPVLLGGVALAAAVAVGVVMSGMDHGNGAGGTTEVGPAKTVTPRLPPGIPGLNDMSGLNANQIEKHNKVTQQWIDVGDSQRTSQNLVQARISYTAAMKSEPNCESCQVRLDSVQREIESKITDYERGGQLHYDQGDYNGAIDRWDIAISFMGDPKSDRVKSLRAKRAEAAHLVQQQPQ